MSKLPVWARKPSHKKTVVATDLGWVVEETGEVLRRVSDLPNKLKQLVDEAREIEAMMEDFVSPHPDDTKGTEVDQLPSGDVQLYEPKIDDQPDTTFEEDFQAAETRVEPSQNASTTDKKSAEQTDTSTEKSKQTPAKTKPTTRKNNKPGKKKSYYQRKKEREQQQKNAE